MDEKWKVFVENRVAFLHLSWTDYEIFEASFSPVQEGWRISSAVVESAPDRAPSSSDQLNRVVLELVLSAIVLGEPAVELRAGLVKLCSPADRPAPPDGLTEHSILGLRSRH